MGLRSQLLEFPKVYGLLTALQRKQHRNWFVDDVIRPTPGQRILDVGCGIGHVLDQLFDVEYVGIDHNLKYILAAQKKHGRRGTFCLQDITSCDFSQFGTFDTVLLLGVLHHLDDEKSSRLISSLTEVLASDSRVISVDCSLVSGQNIVSWLLAKLDRGRHARRPEQYRAIIETALAVESEFIRHDLLNVPYTHAIFCSTLKPNTI
jgi:2-polyprenyl-3-methyl-5-hydroxy-6-metoxy-1,4-benzoquinol methylase